MMTQEPGGPVFICYRREDAGYPAGWLFDQLAARLGADRVFKDVDSIEPGDDFEEVITGAVQSCAVLLAVIGSRWLAAAGPDGCRMDDPGDFVRLEIEAALTRGVRLIPVLVDGARMPRPDQLPAGLAPLARRQAIELSHARFSADLAGLLNVIDKELRLIQALETPSGALPTPGRPARKGPAVLRDADAMLPASVTCFRDDDAGFRRWREDNPDGFFLNTERNPGPGYLMLHRSGCPHFTRSPLHWTKDYIKFCAPDRASLEDWASTLGDVRHCRTCFRRPATGSKRCHPRLAGTELPAQPVRRAQPQSADLSGCCYSLGRVRWRCRSGRSALAPYSASGRCFTNRRSASISTTLEIRASLTSSPSLAVRLGTPGPARQLLYVTGRIGGTINRSADIGPQPFPADP